MSFRKITMLTLIILLYNQEASANWLKDIWQAELRMEGLQSSLVDGQGQLISTQRDIDSLIKELNSHVTGNSGWGSYQYHEYQSYGDNARGWAQVLEMAEKGKSSGVLGGVITDIAQQFPIDSESYNLGATNATNQQYYALKAQTVLSSRAASQLDYDKIQDQILYQQMLQQQIEKTKDLKASIDLSNRMQVENNLIALALLRQSAISNQQHSVNEQASVMAALANARFLTKTNIEGK